MHRRKLLASGLVTLGSLSGCLGYTVQQQKKEERQRRQLTEYKQTVTDLQDQRESRQNRIQSLESELNATQQELNSTEQELDRVQSDLSDAEGTVSEQKDEIQSLREKRDRAQNRQLTLLVELGGANYAGGVSDWDDGRAEWSAGNYGLASVYYARCEGHYLESMAAYQSAADVADRLELFDVRDLLEDNVSYIDYMAAAAHDYANAAYYYSYNNDATGNDYVEKAQQNFESANEYSYTDSSELKDKIEKKSGLADY